MSEEKDEFKNQLMYTKYEAKKIREDFVEVDRHQSASLGLVER